VSRDSAILNLMRWTVLPVLASVLLLGSWPGLAMGQDAADEESYKLGPGDRIIIDVFGEDDLSMEVMLNDNGVLNYPFLGELSVGGLSLGELERMITSGLKGPYLVNPDVSVSIKQYRNVYLNGEVQRPGGYPYQPGLTVEKAVVLAGGFTERASRNKIDVKRSGDPTAEPRRIRMTDLVNPGDVITVHQSFF